MANSSGEFKRKWRTEVISNNLDPKFTKSYLLRYSQENATQKVDYFSSDKTRSIRHRRRR